MVKCCSASCSSTRGCRAGARPVASRGQGVPAGKASVLTMDRAPAESIEANQQQADVPAPAAVPEGLRAPAAARDFAPTLAAADPLVRAGAVGRLQRSAGNAAV